MYRYIKRIEFYNEKIKIVDNVESWEIDGTITDFCPRILDRWLGYIDNIRNNFNKNLTPERSEV